MCITENNIQLFNNEGNRYLCNIQVTSTNL